MDPFSTIAYYHRVDVRKLRRNYKHHSSDLKHWDQAGHTEKYLVYPHNVTSRIAIDEVSLSQGELYTIVSSRDRLKQKRKLIASIKSTRSEDIANVLAKIPLETRQTVKEVSLDMASSMRKAC